MAKTPKTTTAPTGSIAPFGLRMLPELRAKVEESAKESGRSMNAEIAARLQQSFEVDELMKELALARLKIEQLAQAGPAATEVKLSPTIASIVAYVANRNRQTMGEALTTLVVAGFANGSPAVVYFASQPSFTAGGYADVFKAVEAHLAPDTTILIENSGMRVEVRPTVEDDGSLTP